MKHLNNLPLFYVGQKVVAIKDHSQWSFKKGDEFVVRGIKPKPCGCAGWDINIGISNTRDYSTIYCSLCGIKRSWDGYYCASCFAPIQQAKFPLITFEAIKVKEQEQILIDN